ncbi:hypothetical protein ACIPSA_43405 [Streptomyces sp. NPDC086549]|uniref:hypothetical protein n=1 Tax=Streptomyces sp. NPDC086549 TaxID=3365752 RepID=UPI00380F3993
MTPGTGRAPLWPWRPRTDELDPDHAAGHRTSETLPVTPTQNELDPDHAAGHRTSEVPAVTPGTVGNDSWARRGCPRCSSGTHGSSLRGSVRRRPCRRAGSCERPGKGPARLLSG